ncbi:odorant binding protein 12 [Xylocopa sonorina]|uniref:odorant binding protein 12 n=1 Tax=Xylocopa sonorina TaxID=1818115 RepID=UPI00403B054E
MKNVPFLVSCVFCYVIFHRNLIESRARVAVSEDVAVCMDRSNVTIAELTRLRRSSEKRIELINEDGEFRRYGCFLACTLQSRAAMTGSDLDAQRITDSIDQTYGNDFDANMFVRKIVETCADSIATIDDECNVALAFKICTLRAMRNI